MTQTKYQLSLLSELPRNYDVSAFLQSLTYLSSLFPKFSNKLDILPGDVTTGETGANPVLPNVSDTLTFYSYLEVKVTHKPQEIRLISILDCLCGTLQQFFYPMVFLFSASYLCLPEGQAVLQLQLENTICSHHLPSCKLVQKLAPAAHVCMKLLLLIYKAKCIQLCPTNKL